MQAGWSADDYDTIYTVSIYRSVPSVSFSSLSPSLPLSLSLSLSLQYLYLIYYFIHIFNLEPQFSREAVQLAFWDGRSRPLLPLPSVGRCPAQLSQKAEIKNEFKESELQLSDSHGFVGISQRSYMFLILDFLSVSLCHSFMHTATERMTIGPGFSI